MNDDHLRECTECNRPITASQRVARPGAPEAKAAPAKPGAAKPTITRPGAPAVAPATKAAPLNTTRVLSAANLLEQAGDDDLVFKDNADEAATSSALHKAVTGPGVWLHCSPFDPVRLEGEVRLGRSSELEFPLVHIEVSRHHTTVKRMPSGEITVVDNQSANGTFVNGERVTTQTVKIGDKIKIGPFIIVLRDTKDAPVEPVAPDDQETLQAGAGADAGKQLESTMVMGRLEKISLAKILSHVEQQRKTGTVKVWDAKGTKGEIVVGAGSPLNATWGALKDEAAVRAMLRLPAGGAFAFSLDVGTSLPSMKTELSALIRELPPERIEKGFEEAKKSDSQQVLGLLDDYTTRPKPTPPVAAPPRPAPPAGGPPRSVVPSSSRNTPASGGSARAFSMKAFEHAKRGAFDEAIADFSRALEVDPNYTVAYFNRGLAREKKGDTAGAIADYSRAIQNEPQNVAVWMRRAIARGACGELDGSIADCTRVIALDARAAPAYSTRSCARRGKGDLAGAIEDATQALRIDPQLAIALLNRGLAREKIADRRGALEDLERYLQVLPDSPLAANVRTVIERLRA